MKVLLIKDVYKVGHAGDVKRVADGYGRNYLLPQGMAVLATPGRLNQSGRIREEANKQREIINKEMDLIAGRIKDVTLSFAAKAGETGKMYGSITTQDVATALKEKTGVEIKRHQIDMQPLRVLGEHKAHIRLTMDLVPDIKVIVYREGEANPTEETAPAATPALPTGGLRLAGGARETQAAAVPVESAAVEPAPAEALAEEPLAEEQAAAPVEETLEEVSSASEEAQDAPEVSPRRDGDA